LDISSGHEVEDGDRSWMIYTLFSMIQGAIEGGDHSWVIYIPFSRIQGAIYRRGDELEVSGDNAIVKKCTIVSKL